MALNQYFMKKVFLLAAGLAMILTACQKEESLSDPGGVCTQAITVTIPVSYTHLTLPTNSLV